MGHSLHHMHVHVQHLSYCVTLALRVLCRSLSLLQGTLSFCLLPVLGRMRRLLLMHARVRLCCTVACRIQVVLVTFLVTSCLCRGPQAATWMLGVRFPHAGEGSMVGFPVNPKICVLTLRWRRGQVVVQASGRRPGPGTRWSRGGAVTPSILPEVLHTQYVSPGRGLGIRQSMGCRKCGTAESGDLGAEE